MKCQRSFKNYLVHRVELVQRGLENKTELELCCGVSLNVTIGTRFLLSFAVKEAHFFVMAMLCDLLSGNSF